MKNYLGIDVGSISTNLVLTDEKGQVLHSSYTRGSGSPVDSVCSGLDQLKNNFSDNIDISGVCATGSGRELIGVLVGADLIKNEISAHARAAIELYPDVATVIEIGGQDSKVTIIRDGMVVDFAMNLVCAAGTGSFLDSQARRLGITIEEFSKRAMISKSPTHIAGRCTVFAESDMIHKQQMGFAQEDILMGLAQALVRNFLSNICRGKEILPPVLLQGGVSLNQGIKRAFEEALGYEIIVPQLSTVMGAYGAALIAAGSKIEKTRFSGFKIDAKKITTRVFECKDCENLCEIIEILESSEVVGTNGARCGKW